MAESLTNLRFADDVVLFASSNGEPQEMLNQITKLSTDGLQIKLNRIYIPRTTDIIPGQLGKRNQKEDWNGLEQVQDPRVYTGR
jgi:hypothetical protein